jgi:hypothetical protein
MRLIAFLARERVKFDSVMLHFVVCVTSSGLKTSVMLQVKANTSNIICFCHRQLGNKSLLALRWRQRGAHLVKVSYGKSVRRKCLIYFRQ